MNCSPPGSSVHGILQENIGVGCHALLQRIVLIQGLNPGLLHCRQILYHWATREAALSIPIDCLFWILHIYGVIEYVVLWFWLLSLCIKLSRIILCCWVYQYFITFYGQIIFHWIGIPYFVYLLTYWCKFDVILLWTFMYKLLWWHMFSFFLDLCLGVDLLGQMRILCLTLWRNAILLSILATLFYISTCSR